MDKIENKFSAHFDAVENEIKANTVSLINTLVGLYGEFAGRGVFTLEYYGGGGSSFSWDITGRVFFLWDWGTCTVKPYN